MTSNPGHPGHRILFGLGVIGVGVLALLDNLFGLRLLHTFWPLALVLFGLTRLVWPGHAGSWLFGSALIIAGSLLTARNLGITFFSLRDWWPVFIILAGVSILLRGMFPRSLGRDAAPLAAGERIAIDARFSAVRQRSDSASFKGGRIDVSFGGVELDLSQTRMDGAEAVLEISSRFSGIELRVPADWQVIVEVAATAGGVDNRSASPAHATQRLVLRGETLFGGVEIRN